MTDDYARLRQRRRFLLTAGGAGMTAAAGTRALAQTADGRTPPSHWDTTVDVIVIGSGFAGCAAAAAAAEAGASVAVLEKMPAIGGNSAINLGDYAAWDSSLHLRQKFKLGDDSAALHARDMLDAGDGYNDPALVNALVNGAPAALDWMIERGGLKLRDVIHRQGLSNYRMHYGPSGRGIDYIEALRRIADAHRARFYFAHAVSRLWRRDADGPVGGVEVKTPQGTQQWRARRAVIIHALCAEARREKCARHDGNLFATECA